MLEYLHSPVGKISAAISRQAGTDDVLSVLILDDEPDVRETLRAMVASLGLKVDATGDEANFFSRLKNDSPDVVILDLMMPGCDGLDVISKMASIKNCSIIICSGSSIRILDSVSLSAQSLGLEVLGTLQKPLRRKCLKQLLETARTERDPTQCETKSAQERPEISRAMLRSAIMTREITCFLQPKMHLTDGAVFGFEALARWHHPEFGMIFPDEFIPKVAEFGLDYELSVAIIEQAVDALAALSDDKLSVAVNTPANVLTNCAFEPFLADLLNYHGLEPRHILFEVTEVGQSCIPQCELDALLRLSMKGHTLSIDDFGTGASSFERLVRIPFNELKIDRMFVRNLETSRAARGLIRDLVHIGKRFGMSVTVEGVETRESVRILRRLGCDAAQGYGIARPMSASSVRDWLAHYDPRRLAGATFASRTQIN